MGIAGVLGSGRRPYACPTKLRSFYVFVVVVWSGAWRGFESGWLYIAGARGGGNVSPPERSGHVANIDERLQREGTGCSVNAGACPRSWTSTGGGLRWGQAHARTVPFWPRLD